MRENHDLIAFLSGGDRRSLGSSGRVVSLVLENPAIISGLVDLLTGHDPVVVMRAADVLEKVQRKLPPSVFTPFRRKLMALARTAVQPELRWHLTQMLPHLMLSKSQRHALVGILKQYFEDRSAIVRVSALQATVELAKGYDELEHVARDRLEQALRGSAAERARARILLSRFFGITAG
jgi:HEAT repeat protein